MSSPIPTDNNPASPTTDNDVVEFDQRKWKSVRFRAPGLYAPAYVFEIVWVGTITPAALRIAVLERINLPVQTRFIFTCDEFPNAGIVLNEQLADYDLILTFRLLPKIDARIALMVQDQSFGRFSNYDDDEEYDEMKDSDKRSHSSQRYRPSSTAPTGARIIVDGADSTTAFMDTVADCEICAASSAAVHTTSVPHAPVPLMPSVQTYYNPHAAPIVPASNVNASLYPAYTDSAHTVQTASAVNSDYPNNFLPPYNAALSRPPSGSNKRSRLRTSVACEPCIKLKAGCDQQRPCSRCVKRKVPELCVDRKSGRSVASRSEHEHEHDHEENDDYQHNQITIAQAAH
jgi:hypothetical protein